MYETEHYIRLIEELGGEALARYDAEESGRQFGGGREHEQAGGQFTFSAMCRSDQAAVLRAIDENLPTRTKRPNGNTGTSYALKHVIERYVGFYVSNLQAKVAMRVLGYERGGDGLNPCYNVTKREWREFCERSREAADRRSAAYRRMSRRREEQAAARWFNSLQGNGRGRA